MIEQIENIRAYNPWGGNDIALGYRRDFYMAKITPYIGNSLVKVLTGQRRTGKSYILRQIAMELIHKGIAPENILFINSEFSAFNFLQTHEDLEKLIQEYRKELSPQGKFFLFIDEVQNITDWERSVNSLSQDFTTPCEVFISGSNSTMLSGELATHLSGRYVQFEILPFSYKEWCDVHQKEQGFDSYEEYLHDGGLPELIHLNDDEVRRHYMSSLKDTILLRDIISRYSIRDPKLLEDLFVYTVNNATKLTTPNNIVKFYKGKGKKVNYETVASYLAYMTETYIIHKAERYNIQGKETIAGNCKYYINDLSFYNYLYRGFSFGAGYELENLVYLELRRAGYEVYVGTIQGAHTDEHSEVDFVAINGDKKIYVQASYETSDPKTLEREYSSLELIQDHYPKFVVTMDKFQRPIRNGIVHVLAPEFHKVLEKM